MMVLTMRAVKALNVAYNTDSGYKQERCLNSYARLWIITCTVLVLLHFQL